MVIDLLLVESWRHSPPSVKEPDSQVTHNRHPHCERVEAWMLPEETPQHASETPRAPALLTE